ncbi:MAG: DNA mismatch endonuclease Vsr [Prevotella sp.]|nr:DNA mismatch endonuclease Vsr [Prevotella sp.]
MQLSKEKRHKIMASIHSSGTKPELVVRQFLFAHGFRYRLNSRLLPGSPDIVLKKYRTCIFINGCFWHGHHCVEFRKPKSNIEYWNKKIEKNKLHDKAVQLKLAKMGWHCITIWECELKKDVRQKTLESLDFTLNHIFLQDHSLHYSPINEECEIEIAAEP